MMVKTPVKKAEKGSIEEVLASAFKQYDLHVGPLSSIAEDVEAFTTGNIAIDHIIGVGGLPLGRSVEMFGAPSSGKAGRLSSLVLTPDRGFVRMGDVQVGDRVVDPGGSADSVVTGVFPQGVLPVYRVTFDDGSTAEVSGDHLWDVWRYEHPRIRWESRCQGPCSECGKVPIRARGVCINCYNRHRRQGTLAEIPRLLARGSAGRTHEFRRAVVTTDYLRERTLATRVRVQLPHVQPFDFDEGVLPLHPYLVGLLLGDGSLTGGSPTFCCGDEDAAVLVPVVDSLLPKGVSIKRVGKSISYGLTKKTTFPGGVSRPNPLTVALQELGMRVHAWDKSIPVMYKYSSYQTRLAVLQGLMDTDGNWAQSSSEFNSSSQQLRDDVVWLARSLGITVRLLKDKDTYYKKSDGSRVKCRTCYRAAFAERSEVRGFRLDRKLLELRKRGEGRRQLVSVDFIGDDECQCISVSAPSQLYVMDDFIPTHNTSLATMAAAALQKLILAGGNSDLSRGPLVSGDDKIAYFDYEHAMDPAYVKALGLDVDHESFLFAQPESLEQGANVAKRLIETGKVRMVIFDSVASMIPSAKAEMEIGRSLPAVQAKLMSDFLGPLNSLLHEQRCTAVFLNHVMELFDMGGARRPGMPARTSTPGGRALKFYASLRIEFQQIGNIKGKVIDPLSNEEMDQVLATNVRVRVIKNKVAPPFRQTVVRVRYGRGFDNFWTALQILIAHKKIVYSTGYFYFEKAPELVHSDMQRQAAGSLRPYIRGEETLFTFADDHLEWRAAMIAAASEVVAEDVSVLDAVTPTAPVEEQEVETAQEELEDVIEESSVEPALIEPSPASASGATTLALLSGL